MLKFKFKLDSLLRLRENQEEDKKRLLAKSIEKYRLTEIELIEAKEKTNRIKKELQQALQGAITPTKIQELTSYLKQLKSREFFLENKLNKAQEEVEKARYALQEAMKNRKILENLKGIHKEAYLEEMRIEEQKSVDELISFKYTKKGESSNHA